MGTKLQTLDVLMFLITFMAVVGPAAFVSSGSQLGTKLPVLDVFIFFITFLSVITIGSKFVPKTKPKKEIIDKRAAKEARTQHTPTRAHALAHAPANIRASALVRACTRACVPSMTIITLHPFSPCAGKGEETRPRP